MRFDGTLTRLQQTMRHAESSVCLSGLDPYASASTARARRAGFYRGFFFGWLVTALVAGLLFFLERR